MADAQPPFALPELGRSLRSLGSVGNPCAERAHAAVFGPLLEARAQAAAAATTADVLSALRGRPLAARVERLVTEAARSGANDEATARARVAQARELLEPLAASLAALDREAEQMDPLIRINEYSAFVTRLAGVFAAADVACGRLSELLSAGPAADGKWRLGRRQ